MKKILLAITVLAALFIPSILPLVFAQEYGTVSFHLSVTKKTTQGDGIFNFEIEKIEVTMSKIEDFAKVFASDISNQKGEFSITTQNGVGSYASDYSTNAYGFYGVKIKELETEGWKTKNIECHSDGEFLDYQAAGNTIELYGIKNGDNVECEFINGPPSVLRNQVLIVPGLLGTVLNNGDKEAWPNTIELGVSFSDNFINSLAFDNDPKSVNNIEAGDVIKKVVGVFDYSDNLIKELTSTDVGYEIDGNLFTFPYDWRYGVSGEYPDGKTNSDLLKERIEEIRQQTGAGKVDVIAHSLGGLVAKRYVMENEAPHIGKMIFVGVPNLGSPVAAKAILMGHNFDIGVLSADRIRDISRNMPGAYDLLPSLRYRDEITNYIKLVEEKSDGGNSAKNLSFEESRQFLAERGANASALGKSDYIHNISGLDDFDVRQKGVDYYKITGCASGMLMQVKANKNINGNITYEPYSYISSDDTVPFGSADSLRADDEKSFYAIEARHGAMMGEDGIRKTIAGILTGTGLNLGDNVINKHQLANNVNRCSLNGVAIRIYSPLDIVVTDQDGKFLGLDENNNPQNDIPGASFDIIDGHKYLYLPTGEGKKYNIGLQGTGSGTFTLETQNIENDIEKNARVFENIAVTPSLKAILGVNADATVLKLDNDGDGDIDDILTRADVLPDTTAPQINILSPENNKIYINSDIVPVTFDMNDDRLPLDKIKIIINFDGVATSVDAIDLAFQKTGVHNLKIAAQDGAGNIGSKEARFTVIASIDSIIVNVAKFISQGLIEKPKSIVLVARLKAIKTQFAVLNKLETNGKLPEKSRIAAVRALNMAINRQIDLLIREAEKNKGMDVQAAELLADSLRFIKIN